MSKERQLAVFIEDELASALAAYRVVQEESVPSQYAGSRIGPGQSPVVRLAALYEISQAARGGNLQPAQLAALRELWVWRQRDGGVLAAEREAVRKHLPRKRVHLSAPEALPAA